MGSPSYSILYSAAVGSVVSNGLVADVLIRDLTTGRYVLATTAARAGRRSTGIALSIYVANGVVDIQQEGELDATTAGLGAGTASYVRVSTLGRLERVTTPGATDDVVGWVETDGTTHLRFGQPPGGYGSGAAVPAQPGTGNYALQSLAGVLTWVSIATAPTLTSLNYSLGDTAGGGISMVATGTNCASVTTVTIGGNSATITGQTSTTVTFTLPAHAAGSVTVSLTGPGGTSGTLAFEYWTPAQIAGVDAYLDANKGVTGGAAVSAWVDQTSNARNFVQATGANKPAQTSSVFGTLPSIRFAGSQWLSLAAVVALTGGKSFFVGGAWTASTAGNPRPGMPLVSDDYGDYDAFGTDGTGIGFHTYDSAGAAAHYSARGSGLNSGTPLMVGVTADLISNEKFYVGATQQGATNTPGVVDDVAHGYSCVGSLYGHGTGFTGDVGWVVCVSGVISTGDLTKLNSWSQQRFGTP